MAYTGYDAGLEKSQTIDRTRMSRYPWYKAMPFVCAALARHVYHCLKFKQPYDAEKALGVVSPAAEQALLDLQADLDERFEVMEAHLIAEEG